MEGKYCITDDKYESKYSKCQLMPSSTGFNCEVNLSNTIKNYFKGRIFNIGK